MVPFLTAWEKEFFHCFYYKAGLFSGGRGYKYETLWGNQTNCLIFQAIPKIAAIRETYFLIHNFERKIGNGAPVYQTPNRPQVLLWRPQVILLWGEDREPRQVQILHRIEVMYLKPAHTEIVSKYSWFSLQ